jgi:hypothetical protein
MPTRLAREPTVTARGLREPPNAMKRGRADVQAVKREPGVSALDVFSVLLSFSETRHNRPQRQEP